MKAGNVLALLSIALLVIEAVLAEHNGMFYGKDMLLRYGKGFPLIAKGDWWGNLLLITPVLVIAGKYVEHWQSDEVWMMIAISSIVAITLLFFYRSGLYPDAKAGARTIHLAGIVDVCYTTLVLTILLLFYIKTATTERDVFAVCILLLIYIPIANHAVLAALDNVFQWPWCPEIFTAEARPTVLIFISWIVVILATLIKLGISV